MKSLRIVLLMMVVTLLPLPAAASGYEKDIEYELDPMTGFLTDIRIPTLWSVDSTLDFGLFDAGLISWDVGLANAEEICSSAPCAVRLTALNASGAVVATTTVDIQLNGSSTLFTARIDGADVAAVNSFVSNLVFSAAVQLEIQPELAVQKLVNGKWATIWAECEVVITAHATVPAL